MFVIIARIDGSDKKDVQIIPATELKTFSSKKSNPMTILWVKIPLRLYACKLNQELLQAENQFQYSIETQKSNPRSRNSSSSSLIQALVDRSSMTRELLLHHCSHFLSCWPLDPQSTSSKKTLHTSYVHIMVVTFEAVSTDLSWVNNLTPILGL